MITNFGSFGNVFIWKTIIIFIIEINEVVLNYKFRYILLWFAK